MSHNFPKFQHLLLACLMAGMADVAEAGSVQFSTYYPAPFGMYDRLRLVPRANLDAQLPCDPGTLYINNDAGNQLEVCNAAGDDWAPLSGGPWTEDINGVYVTDTAANVGIGTTTPNSKLEVVEGGVIIRGNNLACGIDGDCGAGGKCVSSICQYNLTVDGNVGIGTTTPNNRIQVQDLINFDNARWSTSLGYQAGQVNTGTTNTFVGYRVGDANTTGGGNTASGSQALGANITGSNNTASGLNALGGNIVGSGNTASGSQSLGANTGVENTANGFYALRFNTNGSYNTATGSGALSANTTGSNNIAIGYAAGDNILTGSKNIIIGADIDAPSAAASNQLSIGNLIFGTGLDGTGTTVSTGNIGIGTTTPTSRLHVNAPQGDAPPGVFLENADITVDGGADGQFALRNNSASGTRKIFLGGPGGAYTLTVDALTARVGIGTTTPGGIFHVKGAAPNIYLESTTINGPDLFFSGSGTFDGQKYILYSSGSGNTIGAGKFALQDETAGATRLVVDSTGNVGIGTNAPAARLEVTGGPIKATGGMILPTCTIAAGDCPASPVDGQIWLCTDC